MRLQSGRSEGFTLVELLVVIAVLAILLSIITPVASHGMWIARKAVCASNLHQIHIGSTAGATDNEGFYIKARPTSGWVQKAFNPPQWPLLAKAGLISEAGLIPGTSDQNYKAPLWACPDRDYEPQIEGGYSQLVMGYQYYGGIATWKTTKGSKESRSPINVTTADGRWCLTADAVGKIDRVWGGGRATAYKDMPPHRRKTPWPEGGNVGFVDGSVKWIRFDDMIKFHSWNWGGNRDYYSYQEDLGDYVPSASDLGKNNKF